PEAVDPAPEAAEPAPEAADPAAPAEAADPAADEAADPAADEAAEPEAAEPKAEAAEPKAEAAEPKAGEPKLEPLAVAASADPKDGELIDISDRVRVAPSLLHNAEILGVTRDGCLLTITVKINVDGSYTLQVWDDGELIGELPLSGEAGDVRVLQYLMTANVGTLVPGYDFVIVNQNGEKVVHYNWDFEGSESVMAECHEKAACGGAASGTAAGEPAAMAGAAAASEPAEAAGSAEPVAAAEPAEPGAAAEPVAAAEPAKAAEPAEAAAPVAPMGVPELAHTGTSALIIGLASVLLMGAGAAALRIRRRRA
ncbi:MAG: hypothetical protein DI576_15380, partial [Actinomyces sp.]